MVLFLILPQLYILNRVTFTFFFYELFFSRFLRYRDLVVLVLAIQMRAKSRQMLMKTVFLLTGIAAIFAFVKRKYTLLCKRFK